MYERPLCAGASGSVRQTQKHQWARWASVVQTFCPLMTHCVAVEHRAGLDVREVRAGVRLRVPLAPELLDRLDLGEEALLLLLGAVRDERRGEQALAEEADPGRRTRLGVLLVEDHLLDDAGVAAAVLLGPGQADPAVLAEQALPLDADVVAGLVGRTTAGAELGELADQVLGQPGTHLVAECCLGGSVAKVHRAGVDRT